MNPYRITPLDLIARCYIDYLMDADACRVRDRAAITIEEIQKMVSDTTPTLKDAQIAI